MLKFFRGLMGSRPEPVPDDKIGVGDVLRHGWLELWYQPKIDLKTMRMTGAEALARARHPTRGVLGPGVFLPGASEDEMLALTEAVTLRALRDWRDCAAAGMSVKFAVNVPVSALMKLPLAKLLQEERPKAENWPGLILEVTEDEIIRDLKVAYDVAEELGAHGGALALDDFGAGYSSLARLRQLPFCELKIDRSYVSNCHTDRFNAGLCETIVELGKRFELKTVAEGIESTHEAHKLQALGCDIGQGYLFARPMAKDRFVDLLRRRVAGRPAA